MQRVNLFFNNKNQDIELLLSKEEPDISVFKITSNLFLNPKLPIVYKEPTIKGAPNTIKKAISPLERSKIFSL